MEVVKNASEAALNAEAAAMRKDLAELKIEIIKWNTGTLLAATGLFALIVKLMG